MAPPKKDAPSGKPESKHRLPQPAGYWLQRQPEEFRQAFVALATFQTLAAGDTIWRMGDELDFMMGVVEGCVAHSWATPDSEVALAHLWWNGDWFGESEFIAGAASYTITQARMPTRIAKVKFAQLRVLLDENPKWWACIANLATEHTILAGDTIMDLMVHDPAARCMAILLRIAGGRVQSGQPVKSTMVPISQSELAELTNLHRNSVVNILRKLSEEGLVAHHYRAIELVDPVTLRERVLRHSQPDDSATD